MKKKYIFKAILGEKNKMKLFEDFKTRFNVQYLDTREQINLFYICICTRCFTHFDTLPRFLSLFVGYRSRVLNLISYESS